MRQDTIPIFDEAGVAAELDGDRELLFEIVEMQRQKIQEAVEKLDGLSFGDPSVRQIAARIAQSAGRVRARRLEFFAREMVLMGPERGPLSEAIPDLLREARIFLAETQFVL